MCVVGEISPMAAIITSTTPYWATTDTFPSWPRLADDLVTDVVVVGAGVTGLTTACLLARAGKRVVVVDRERCASGDTGHTTAHVTMVTDTRLTELATRFGRNHAQAVWDAGLAAMATIDELVRDHAIDAGFEWCDGYLHVPIDDHTGESARRLHEDARLASDLGFDATFVESIPLVSRPGMRVGNQARIHPRRYLAGIARAFVALGGQIYEHSAAEEFSDDPRAVTVAGHTVHCEDVVLATHNPLVGLSGCAGATLFQTKLALYTSYVIAGRAPKGLVPDALWWDTSDPYSYLRVEPRQDFDVVILGGEDHKTGQQDDTEQCYRRLGTRLSALLPQAEVTHRWSGQVIETPDGLPYIGHNADHQYVATGYAGNGMTFGTLAGLMISDAILGRSNPWAELFDPGRKALTRGLWDYIKENADYPYYMIRDRFAGPDPQSLRAVKRGQGSIVERNGAKVAVYRDETGNITFRSAICTHMGCAVTWNIAERTWDCPCHGSRFTPRGDVISGPAETPLPAAE
jgi:glycine/D-amino acid oxidase-like deaminating enzyme/nitrite reductase/ring-hydroxylating ferredoxin subunit